MTDQNPELTEEAKKEIAAAVAIVREDKILRYIRENRNPSSNGSTDPDPNSDPVDPTIDPPVVDPNKPTPPPVKPPVEPAKTKKRGLYWGDQVDDE